MYYNSPLGTLAIQVSDHCLTSLSFVSDKLPTSPRGYEQEVVRQLDQYFAHQRTSFDLEIELRGTAFQQRVWLELISIPYGQTCSYKQLAENLGEPLAARAIGQANHRNRIALVIPCHRVVAASGKIGGYAGGVDKKQWLLQHERQHPSVTERKYAK